jgi:hypothetical protein
MGAVVDWTWWNMGMVNDWVIPILYYIGFIANRAKRTPTNVSEGLQKTQIFQ